MPRARCNSCGYERIVGLGRVSCDNCGELLSDLPVPANHNRMSPTPLRYRETREPILDGFAYGSGSGQFADAPPTGDEL